jgi:hypothetical protein
MQNVVSNDVIAEIPKFVFFFQRKMPFNRSFLSRDAYIYQSHIINKLTPNSNDNFLLQNIPPLLLLQAHYK